MASELKQLAQLNLASAGTAQALSASSIEAAVVIFTAKTGNGGLIYIGDSDVSATEAAIELAAGETYELRGVEVGAGPASFNLADIYFDGGTTNDDLHVGYVVRNR